MTTVVAYCRISRDREGAGLGVDRQAADFRDLAARLRLPEPKIIKDNDLSAYSGKRRPGYEELKEGLREGRWTHLLLWHVDRQCRSLKDLEEIVDLVNGKVAVHTVRGGEIDLESSEGRMTARILGTLARYESEHRSDRVRAKLAANAKLGKLHGGPPPYGFGVQVDTVKTVSETGEPVSKPVFDATQVNAAEAAIVAELTRRVVGGESVRALARDLRERGVPSRWDARWDPSVVRRMVLRPRNAGLVEYRGEIVIGDDGEPVKATSPALVDRDLWETACAVLTDPARKTSTGNKPTRLLSGIARCWCGAPVLAGGVRGGVAVYRCADSEHLKRRVDLVDGVVVEHILAVLRREKVAHRGPTGPTPGVREKTDALRKRIAQVEDALVGDPTDDLKEVSQAGLRRNLVRLRAQLADMERHEALDRVPGAAEGVTAENFPTLPFERRRAVVAYFATVRLLKTRPGRFDPDSVEVRSARRP